MSLRVTPDAATDRGQPAEALAGLVERVTFHNADTGFCVLRVKVRGQRDLITVVGHAATVAAGEWVQLSGTWFNRHWPAIEAAARRAEPGERRQRKESRKASPEHDERRAEAAEHRRCRYPVPEDAPPPFNRVLMTHVGPVVFEAVTGELVEQTVAVRFYPGVATGPATLIWTTWRRPSHAELVRAWPARTAPDPARLACGWWQPTIEVLRKERRRAASFERAQATRRAKAVGDHSPDGDEGLR